MENLKCISAKQGGCRIDENGQFLSISILFLGESHWAEFTRERLMHKPSMVMPSTVLNRPSKHMDRQLHMEQYFHGIHLYEEKKQFIEIIGLTNSIGSDQI